MATVKVVTNVIFPPLFISGKSTSVVGQPQYGTDMRQIEQWKHGIKVTTQTITTGGGGGGYASLTGPGKTTSPGALTQNGNFTVDGIFTNTGTRFTVSTSIATLTSSTGATTKNKAVVTLSSGGAILIAYKTAGGTVLTESTVTCHNGNVTITAHNGVTVHAQNTASGAFGIQTGHGTARIHVYTSNPNGHVPGHKGDLCIDQGTPQLWMATAGGSTSWVKVKTLP